MIYLEVNVYSVSSAQSAEQGGAHRVELCDNLSEGGTTPSYGMVMATKKAIRIPVYAMVRPRGGDFLYTGVEFDIMKNDIISFRKAGVDGVVFGILNENGQVDRERCRELVRISRNMSLTFHRAFDMTSDPFRALEDIIDLGFHRVLTSGQAPSAIEGAEMIARLMKQAAGRIILMPGGGINEMNITRLWQSTGAHEFHISARRRRDSLMKHRNEQVHLIGPSDMEDYSWYETDTNKVQNTVHIINQWSPT
jgi:copper homeostasis protein